MKLKRMPKVALRNLLILCGLLVLTGCGKPPTKDQLEYRYKVYSKCIEETKAANECSFEAARVTGNE